MRFVLMRGAGLLLALCIAAGARADDLADFNSAVEAAMAHNRVAIGYLRTGNTDLAAIELDRLRAAWAQVGRRPRPAAFKDNPLYVTAMTDIATRLATADMMLNSGRPDIARQALQAIRDDLYELRKSAHVPALADCVRDANAAMDELMRYDGRPLDSGIVESARRYGALLARCDRMADGKTRDAPEFRRLIDGAAASLARIPEAVAAKDEDLLHRLLIELRSYDNLLAFRFG